MSFKLVDIGDICTTTQGVQISKSETSDRPFKGGYRYLYIADFLSDKNLSFVADKFDSKKVSVQDLVMANTGSPGRVFKGKDGILSNNLFKISFDKNVVDRDYLYLVLSSSDFQTKLQQQMKGGIQKHLGHKTISRQKIPLPPLAEQEKIAAILDAADSLRQKDQQLVERYTALSQSLFLEMFGDPVTNPMGWECLHLGDMLSYLTSGSRGWAKYYSQNGDVFLRIQNIGKNRLILNDITYVNPPVNAEARRTKVEPGDILLSITADLGRTAVIPENFPTAYINQHLAILRVKKEFLPFFVSQFISSVGGETQFLKLDKGGVKAGLNFDDIKSLIIINPPMNLQNQFAERIQLIEAQKQQAQRSLEKSEALFNSLLQRAFTGELTTKIAA